MQPNEIIQINFCMQNDKWEAMGTRCLPHIYVHMYIPNMHKVVEIGQLISRFFCDNYHTKHYVCQYVCKYVFCMQTRILWNSSLIWKKLRFSAGIKLPHIFEIAGVFLPTFICKWNAGYIHFLGFKSLTYYPMYILPSKILKNFHL